MNRRKLQIAGWNTLASILITTALVILLAACEVASAGQAEGGMILTDGLGRQVSLAGPAQRIVSLAPSNTEILFAIGAGDQVVGRDDFSNFPEAALGLPTVGWLTGTPNLEQISALEPDLVLVSELTAPEQVDAIANIGLTVYYLGNPGDLDGLYANLETVAVLTGHEVTAMELVASLKERAQEVESVVTGAETIPVVYYELDGTDPAKPWTAGPGTFIDYLISKSRGENLGGSLNGEWVQISQEEVLMRDPDIILLGDSVFGMTPELVTARPGWDSLKAARNGTILPFNDDLVSRPGPRLVEGLEALAQTIHPELYP